MKRVMLFSVLLMASATTFGQDSRPLSRGQELYLPIYSNMLYGNLSRAGAPSRILLSAMVAIRNTDPNHPMRVTSARYFDSKGKFLREYLAAPVEVPPMGTKDLFVELHDDSGGSGANFMIRWEAAGPVNPPLVEALHANMDSGKAVVFSTQALPVPAR